MGRRVKDFVEIGNYISLDALIERLVEVRDGLPPLAEPEVKMRGDDIFGRKLSIGYFREQTAEEIACDARYARAYQESRERELARLEQEPAMVRRAPRDRAGRLRAVA